MADRLTEQEIEALRGTFCPQCGAIKEQDEDGCCPGCGCDTCSLEFAARTALPRLLAEVERLTAENGSLRIGGLITPHGELEGLSERCLVVEKINAQLVDDLGAAEKREASTAAELGEARELLTLAFNAAPEHRSTDLMRHIRAALAKAREVSR